ncbi:MAG: magnesium transporter, partial [Aestuariivirgaceae bacterium]
GIPCLRYVSRLASSLLLDQTMNKIADIMNPPVVTLAPDDRVSRAIATIRSMSPDRTFTYPMVIDGKGRLLGICTLRDLILAAPDARIADVMLTRIVSLRPQFDVQEALDAIKGREIPEYPVCSEDGTLIGVIRAAKLHELQETRLAAVPGRMVGVAEEETVSTPFVPSVRSRLPWLMINLLTAFAAGLVVGNFQATIDQVVLLAVFLPVLAGQSGNTGAQALAITLRTLDRHADTSFFANALWKELRLGLFHSFVTGVIVAAAIYGVAVYQGNRGPAVLAAIGFGATILSVVISGISGATVPVALKKFGADPAAASSIILTTVTDIVSMGSMLIFASLLLDYLI